MTLKIDYKLGEFHGTCTWSERHLFKEAGFYYSNKKKVWVTTRAEYAEKLEGAEWSQAALDHQGGLEWLARTTAQMSYSDTTDFRPPAPDALHPRTGLPFAYLGYQSAGVEMTLRHFERGQDDVLIADAPGLGKTIQAVGVSNCLPARKILVIAPASLKVNWLREWGMWGTQGLKVGIAEVSHRYKVQEGFFKNGNPKMVTKIMPEFWPDSDVVIINADILDRFEDQIKGQAWDLLIVDEAHSLKSDESYRTLFILGGRRKEKIEGTRKKVWRKYLPIKTKNRLFLTGTPILNRPVELWPIVKAFDRKGLGHSWESYVYRYCDAWFDQYRGKFGALDVSGASNKEELGQKLRAAFMIRRLKKDVLKDLPPKSRNIVLVDSPEIRELVAREDELARALKLYETDILGKVTDDAISAMLIERAALYGFGVDSEDGPKFKDLNLDWASGVLGLEPPMIEAMFNEITLIRRDLGLAKLPASIPWVKDFLDGGEKLVLFAYHTDVILAMKEALAEYNPAVIYGATAVKKRQLEVDKFQNDESCRVIILNILAGGVGHTLTRASDVAFLEGDWVPSNLLQAEDRVHRIGQTADRIRVFYLLADGSLDARIAQSSKMKEDNISAILDT